MNTTDIKIGERLIAGFECGLMGFEEPQSLWRVQYRREDGTEYEKWEHRAPLW